MTTPIILFVGQAGSGKDTAAELVAKNYNAQTVAMADEMKRFTLKTFGFTETQLWGPSFERNKIDTRFTDQALREQVLINILGFGPEWIQKILPKASTNKVVQANEALIKWAQQLLMASIDEGGITPRKVLQTLWDPLESTCRHASLSIL